MDPLATGSNYLSCDLQQNFTDNLDPTAIKDEPIEYDENEDIAEQNPETFVYVQPDSLGEENQDIKFNPLTVKQEEISNEISEQEITGDGIKQEMSSENIEQEMSSENVWRFDSSDTTIAHMQRLHFETKRFSCTYCNKKFATNSYLKAHEKCHFSKDNMHISQRKFPCHFCEKSFAQLSRLKTHELKHTKDEIHQCHYCEEKFHWVGLRFTHIINVHSHELHSEMQGKIMYDNSNAVCLLCNFKGQRRSVQYHIYYKSCDKDAQEQRRQARNVITKQKMHKCEFCTKAYAYEHYLQNHVKKMHAETMMTKYGHIWPLPPIPKPPVKKTSSKKTSNKKIPTKKPKKPSVKKASVEEPSLPVSATYFQHTVTEEYARIPCEYCEWKFHDIHGRFLHYLRDHRYKITKVTQEKTIKWNRKYVCTECQFTGKVKDVLFHAYYNLCQNSPLESNPESALNYENCPEKLESKNQESEHGDGDVRNKEFESDDKESEFHNRELVLNDQESGIKSKEMESRNQEFEPVNQDLALEARELGFRNKKLESKDQEIASKGRESEFKNQGLESKSQASELTSQELESRGQDFTNQELESSSQKSPESALRNEKLLSESEIKTEIDPNFIPVSIKMESQTSIKSENEIKTEVFDTGNGYQNLDEETGYGNENPEESTGNGSENPDDYFHFECETSIESSSNQRNGSYNHDQELLERIADFKKALKLKEEIKCEKVIETCIFCYKKFDFKTPLYKHYVNDHKDEVEEYVDKRIKPFQGKMFECLKCKFKTKRGSMPWHLLMNTCNLKKSKKRPRTLHTVPKRWAQIKRLNKYGFLL